jgi:hypothetical protein
MGTWTTIICEGDAALLGAAARRQINMSQRERNSYEFEDRIETLDRLGEWEETMLAATAIVSVLIGGLLARALWMSSPIFGLFIGVAAGLLAGGYFYYRKELPSQVMATGLYTAGEIALASPFLMFATVYLRSSGASGLFQALNSVQQYGIAFAISIGFFLLAIPLFGGGFLFDRRARSKLGHERRE